MKMLTIKNTAAALMAVLLSTNVYAMDNDEENRPTARTAALSPADTQEKEAFKAVIKRAVPDNDFNAIDTALRQAEGRPWFDQKGVNWIFELATFHIRQYRQKPVDWFSASPDSPNIELIIEKLLSRKGSVRPSLDCVVSVFTKSKDNLGGAKVAMLDYLAQQGAIQRVLGQINVNDTLSEASARGKLPLVQRLLALAPGQSLTDTIESAAFFGQMKTFNFLLKHARAHGTFSQELLNGSLKSAVMGHDDAFYYGVEPNYLDPLKTVRSIRDVINYLLNMNHKGPTQESVDLAFRSAVRFSSVNDEGAAYPSMGGELRSDLHLVKTMLFDPKTGQLRTGLRPSNVTIQYHRDSQYTGKKITTFLKSLSIATAPTPVAKVAKPTPVAKVVKPAPAPVPAPAAKAVKPAPVAKVAKPTKPAVKPTKPAAKPTKPAAKPTKPAPVAKVAKPVHAAKTPAPAAKAPAAKATVG